MDVESRVCSVSQSCCCDCSDRTHGLHFDIVLCMVGFGENCCFSELQRLFLALTEDRVPIPIWSTPSFLPTNSTRIIRVPRLACTSIIVNGKAAPCVDAMGHRRLNQCKHNTVSGNKAGLNVKDALTKLGVLKAGQFIGANNRLNWFLTDRLLKQWERMDCQARFESHIKMGQMRQDSSLQGRSGADELVPNGGTRLLCPMGPLDCWRFSAVCHWNLAAKLTGRA